MTRPMTETEWEILFDLHAGKLRWGAAVGACWGNLVAHGYVEKGFGGITRKGVEAMLKHTQGPTDHGLTKAQTTLDDFIAELEGADRVVVESINALGAIDAHYRPASTVLRLLQWEQTERAVQSIVENAASTESWELAMMREALQNIANEKGRCNVCGLLAEGAGGGVLVCDCDGYWEPADAAEMARLTLALVNQVPSDLKPSAVTSATQGVLATSGITMQARKMSPLDWTEDAAFEDGTRVRNCASCGRQYTGTSVRTLCKVCADQSFRRSNEKSPWPNVVLRNDPGKESSS